MLKNKIKAFSVLAFVLAISLSLFGLSLDKPSGFVFAAEAETSLSEESTTGNTTEANAVAKIGNTEYTSLSEAVAAAKAGETVTLVADTAENIVVDKDLTIDLGDYTISNDCKVANSAVVAVNSGNLVLNANKGGIYGGEGSSYKALIVNNAATVTINGGNYTVGGDGSGSSYGEGNETIAIYGSGDIVINGGTFSSEKDWNKFYYVLNVKNGKTGTFVVKGGTFIKYNPAVGDDNMHGNFVPEGYRSVDNGDGSYTVKKLVAKIGDVEYTSLKEAFDGAKKGDVITLTSDITLTEEIDIVSDIVSNITLDGANHTITCATTDDPSKSGGSALYFGRASTPAVYCTGVKIKNLNMVGKARFGIFLCGGTTTEFTNVNISGEYLYAINLYGTHGGTFTDCNISNSLDLGADNENGAAVWSNVASANPVILNNTTISRIAINTYTTANTLEPKIKVGKNSVTEIYTYDDGSVSNNKKLCVDPTSEGKYTVYQYVDGAAKEIVVAKIGENTYASLAEAVQAAKSGETITLCSDYYDYSKVSAGIVYNIAGITLDLNGYTYISENFGHVFEGTDGLITNGKMVCNKGSSYALFVGGDEEETIGFTVKNVEFEGGINVYNASGVVLENCTVQGTNYYAVWLDEGAFVTIKSGTYTAGEKANVNGAKDCSALVIEGGVFNTNGDTAFLGTGGCTLTVSGGTFVGNEPNLTKDNFAKGFTLAKNEDGTYGVIEYSTLKEYLVNLGTSITLKVSVKEVGKNVKVTYVYNGGEEVKIEKHADGFYYIENITPQIIDRVYIVKVYEGETVVDSKELSVLGYCDTLLGTTSATEKAKTAVKALVYYGKAAKEFLGITNTTAIDEVIKNHDLTETELSKPTSGATSTGENLISKVTLNVSDVNAIVYAMTAENYATVYGENSGYTVTIGGENISADKWTKDGDLYVYTGAGIYASELGKQVEVVIKNGEETVQTLVYGVYDYCANKWETDGVSGIAKAIYAYGVACAEYIAK